jgi:diguanylate cyclase (GGDEF)-like protein
MRRRRLGSFALTVMLLLAVAAPMEPTPAFAASCAAGHGPGAKAHDVLRQTIGAIVVRAGHQCPPSPLPAPATAPTPLPKLSQPPAVAPSISHRGGSGTAPAVSSAGVAAGVGSVPAPGAVGADPAPAEPVIVPSPHSQTAPALGASHVAVPELAAVLEAVAVAARVGGAVTALQAQLWVDLYLLLAAITILFVARRRRHERLRIRDQLAASAGLSPSALKGIPVSAAAALLDVVTALTVRSESLVKEAAFDELTGVYRRGPGMDALTRDVARAERALVPVLAVAMVDVDGLKAINDSAGHAAGDELLCRVAGAIRGRLRMQDLVFRYGGDEFACVFPNTDSSTVFRLLGKIDESLWESTGRRVFSFGVAQFRPGDSAEALLERADRALYAVRAAQR